MEAWQDKSATALHFCVATDGTSSIERVVVGRVVSSGMNDTYEFQYRPGENVETVWKQGSKDMTTTLNQLAMLFVILQAWFLMMEWLRRR